jgi:hypothetical protein
MTLEEYIRNRKAAFDGFRRWMELRATGAVATGLEGWDKLFRVWELMMDNGVPEPDIDNALHALAGGWYVPLPRSTKG